MDLEAAAAAAGEPCAPAFGAQERIDYAGLPKVELHVHMDGACRVDTLRELSRQHQLDYPHDDEEEFKKRIMLLSPTTSLTQFLEVFGAICNILCTKEAVERVAYEYCEELGRQNVVYFELRHNPMGKKMEPEQYVEGVTAGLERGEKDFGVKSRQILAFIRGKPEDAGKVLELALKYRPRGVVGVDIAGNELLPLDPIQIQALLAARANGLHLTMHAGESGPPDNVRQAIEEFGAERIGHGYRVLEDEAIYKLAREKNVHFEACLTSSIFTNSQKELESHAVKRWALDGTSFSLSTDDPGVIGNDLLTEYRVASQEVGLTKEQLVKSVSFLTVILY
jgi:adenosine deaminase